MKVKFLEQRQTKIVSLPSFEGSQVEVYSALTVWENRAVLAEYPDVKEWTAAAFEASLALLCKGIKSRNFTDEEDKDLPITVEVLLKFPQADVTFLLETLTGKKLSDLGSVAAIAEEKKN